MLQNMTEGAPLKLIISLYGAASDRKCFFSSCIILPILLLSGGRLA